MYTTRRIAPLLAVTLALAFGPGAAFAQRMSTASAVAARSNTAAVSRPRLHVLTRDVMHHLAPRTQANVRAVARFGRRATGFLVLRGDDQGSRRALVLTNYHVAGGENFRADEPLTFSDAVRGRTVRVVASSPTLDYALVEIDLPAHATAAPAPIRASGMVPSERVYSVSAYPNLAVQGRIEDSIAVNHSNRRLLQMRSLRGAATIQAGRLPADVAPVTITAGGHEEQGVLTDMPNRPGGSGSPVFGRSDHRVVGLHSAGGGHPGPWESTEIPIDRIIADVAHSLGEGTVPEGSRDLAGALVRQYAPATPAHGVRE